MSRATYKSPAQLVRLRKTLLLNSQTFCNWNALQLTAPSGTGQERAFKTHEGLGFFLCVRFLQLFPWIWEEAKAFQSFYKTNKQNQIPFPTSQREEHPGQANRPLPRCFLGGESPTGRARTGIWVSCLPVFSHPWCSLWFELNCLLRQGANLLGENFMVWACWETVSKEGSIRMGVFLWKVWLSLYPLFSQKSVSGKAPLVLLSMDTQSCGSMGQKLRESKRSPGFLLCDGPNSLLV